MHSAALYHYYWRWRTQKRSIEHTELTFNEALAFRWPSDQLGPPVIRLYSLLKATQTSRDIKTPWNQDPYQWDPTRIMNLKSNQFFFTLHRRPSVLFVLLFRSMGSVNKSQTNSLWIVWPNILASFSRCLHGPSSYSCFILRQEGLCADLLKASSLDITTVTARSPSPSLSILIIYWPARLLIKWLLLMAVQWYSTWVWHKPCSLSLSLSLSVPEICEMLWHIWPDFDQKQHGRKLSHSRRGEDVVIPTTRKVAGDVLLIRKKLHSLRLAWPLKICHPKRKLVFQPFIFRCELLVSGRVTCGTGGFFDGFS